MEYFNNLYVLTYIGCTMLYGAYIGYKNCLIDTGLKQSPYNHRPVYRMKDGYLPNIIGTTIFQPIIFPINALLLGFTTTYKHHN